VSGGGIFRARLRPDRFVAVTGGSLTTVPLRFPRGTLYVNATGPVNVTLPNHRVVVARGRGVMHRIGRVAGPGKLHFAVPRGSRLYSFVDR
jgi:hypothetical protein